MELALVGKVTGDDLRELLAVVTNAEAELPVTPDRIMDMSDADTSALVADTLVAVAEVRRFTVLRNKIKSAVIAPRSEQYGLARMFAGYNQNPDITIMLFRDAASAWQWLGRQPKVANHPHSEPQADAGRADQRVSP